MNAVAGERHSQRSGARVSVVEIYTVGVGGYRSRIAYKRIGTASRGREHYPAIIVVVLGKFWSCRRI